MIPSLFTRVFHRTEPITIVSGLPRSGTSMMMKMLDAGGIPPLTDNERTADEDNPKGYYEFERVKQLDTDTSWVKNAQGKAVKVISMLLKKLPHDHSYRIIFMERPLPEVLASQRKMLERRGEPTDRVDNGGLALMYEKHLADVRAWLENTAYVNVLAMPYHNVLSHPVHATEKIVAFLQKDLNKEKMCRMVDPNLYRQRRA